jgi:hypothetical protein
MSWALIARHTFCQSLDHPLKFNLAYREIAHFDLLNFGVWKKRIL